MAIMAAALRRHRGAEVAVLLLLLATLLLLSTLVPLPLILPLEVEGVNVLAGPKLLSAWLLYSMRSVRKGLPYGKRCVHARTTFWYVCVPHVLLITSAWKGSPPASATSTALSLCPSSSRASTLASVEACFSVPLEQSEELAEAEAEAEAYR